MFHHFLESSIRGNFKKWSNTELGEEVGTLAFEIYIILSGPLPVCFLVTSVVRSVPNLYHTPELQIRWVV